MLLLQREFETRDLPAINLMCFDGDFKQWPNFIQNFTQCTVKQLLVTFHELFIKCVRWQGKEGRKSNQARQIFLCQRTETFKTGIW